MNKDQPFLHYDTENSYQFHVAIVLIPLILYGFYKNGILPFLNQDITLIPLLRPLFFPIIGYGIGLIVDYIVWWQGDQKKIWTNCPLYGVLITMTLPLNANLFLVALLLLGSLLGFRYLEKTKWKVSNLLTTKIIFILLFSILAKVSFMNATETNQTIVYSLLDTFFGRSIGGIASTSIFWMMIAFFFLSFDYYYKKEIPIYTIITFILLSLLFEMISPTGDFLKFILNPSFFFACIFFATEMSSSPYTPTGKRVYGIVIGTLGFLITRYYNPQDGIYLSIFLTSLFVPWIDKISYKMEKKNQKFCRTSFFQKENVEKNPL